MIESYKRFLFHSLVTLKEMSGGFLIALTAAFPLAWIMLCYKTSRAIIQPVFLIIQCLPMFTLAPIMVIWFGWSYTAIVIPTALMIFFPLTLNIYQGLRATPQDLLDFFRSNQATSMQTFFKLQLPWAVPHIFAGFRIAAAIAGIGAIAGEWAGAQNGLGILMLESRRNTDLEVTFGALFCLTIMSALFYTTVITVERFILPPRKWIKKLKTKFPVTAIFLLFISMTFLACQEKKNYIIEENDNTKMRLLLDWLPNPNHVPLYVGIEKGFFAEENLNLQLQKMHESGNGIAYLTSHQADLLLNHMPGTMRAKARGAEIKIIGCLIKEPLNAIIYLENIGIAQETDLNGKRLGYCLGGPDTAFLDCLIEEKNIHFKEQFNVGIDLISAIGTHNVDAIFGAFWNIEPSQLASLGVNTSYFPIRNFNVPNYYEMIILARDDTLKENPHLADGFSRALDKSIQFCKKNPEEAFLIYSNYHPDKREKTLNWERNAWFMTVPILAADQSIEINELLQFYDWMQQRTLINNSFEVTSLVP